MIWLSRGLKLPATRLVFNSLMKPTTKDISKIHITAVCHRSVVAVYLQCNSCACKAIALRIHGESMSRFPDMQNCGLRMHRECRERFLRHRLQKKPLFSYLVMHHGTCVTHVPRCMSGSLTRGGGENVPGIPVACATRNFAYLESVS